MREKREWTGDEEKEGGTESKSASEIADGFILFPSDHLNNGGNTKEDCSAERCGAFSWWLHFGAPTAPPDHSKRTKDETKRRYPRRSAFVSDKQ